MTFQPQAASFYADPYPTYRYLRDEQPIAYYQPWDKWLISRHEDVTALLRDKRLGRVIHHLEPALAPAAKPEHAPFAAIQAGSLLEIEPPDHTRIRQVVHEVFTPKHVRELGEKIKELCQELVEALAHRQGETVDLLKDFAEPIPVTVIADLLGVPAADRQQLLPWSKAIIGMFEPERSPEAEQAAVQAAQDFADYIRHLIAQKRTSAQDDLISRMVHSHDGEPERISESEIVANAILFLNAGHEAVVNVIGNGLYALLKHPEAYAKLKADRRLIDSTIEEMMRYDSPLQFFERFVLQDITYQGVFFPKGTKLALFYASANHDERVFAQPEVFAIDRSPNPHIAFGLGLHYCIGAPLARLELSTALGILLSRLPDLTLAAEPRYLPKNVFRYLEKLEASIG
jgi:unspecific monooxygenase